MRDRSQRPSTCARPKLRPADRQACGQITPEIARQFAPEQFDLDHLAEAIRFLLRDERTPQTDAPRHDLDLLLTHPRGSHVVGAPRTP